MNGHLWLTLDTIRDRHAHQPEVAWLLGQVEALQRVNEYQADEWAKAVAECRRLREEVCELRRRVGDMAP